MAAEKKTSPNVESRLRHNILKMPQEVYAASGIVINGRRLKSFVFTTDLAIIRNCDADAVFAVYPFTPQQAISDAIIKASYIPVFCGVGGGTTHGVRTLNLARDVESQGAMGVVLNSPISDLNLLAVSRVVDIPVIITVTKEDTNIQSRIDSGASILNVACSTDTPRGGGKNPGAVPGCAHHRQRRQDRREHFRHHCGGCQRHYLHAALSGCAVQGNDGEIPGMIYARRCNFFLLQRLFYTMKGDISEIFEFLRNNC